MGHVEDGSEVEGRRRTRSSTRGGPPPPITPPPVKRQRRSGSAANSTDKAPSPPKSPVKGRGRGRPKKGGTANSQHSENNVDVADGANDEPEKMEVEESKTGAEEKKEIEKATPEKSSPVSQKGEEKKEISSKEVN